MGKLVRDYIPNIIEASGKIPVVHTVEGRLPAELFDKLKEETEEACNASDRYELIQELADIYEVISVIATCIDCNIRDIEDVARVKRNTRGSFERGYVLDEVKDK